MQATLGPAGKRLHWMAMMGIRSVANCLTIVASLALIAGSAGSQTCDSLLGGANCGAKPQNVQQNSRASTSYGPQGNTDWRLGSGSATGGLGSVLSSRDDQPATFGAITFGGGGTTVAGHSDPGIADAADINPDVAYKETIMDKDVGSRRCRDRCRSGDRTT